MSGHDGIENGHDDRRRHEHALTGEASRLCGTSQTERIRIEEV